MRLTSLSKIAVAGRVLTLTLLLIASAITPAVGNVTAQEGLAVGIDIPTESSVNEEVSISAPVVVPDMIGSYETNLTFTLLIDGQEVVTKTITVHDGERSTVSFSHALQSEGTHTITVEAGITIAGRTFSNSASRTIEVKATDMKAPSTSSESAGSAVSSTVSGAAFSAPPFLQDEIASYRNQSPLNLAPYALVLAKDDELYLVFTDEQPSEGIVTVKGVSPKQEISTQGFSFNILVASSVSYDTRGTIATVEQISSNPGSYQLKLVQVKATHRRASTLTDPDQGNDPTVATSSGVLVQDPRTAGDVFSQSGKKISSLVVNTSTNKLGSNSQAEINSLLRTQQPHLYTFGFETEFWTNAETTVDGIVLTPGSKAREFATKFDQAGIVQANAEIPLLYVTNSEFNPQNYDTVATLQSQANSGEVVSVTAKLHGQTLSVQETLESTTPCGTDLAQIPTPSGPVCVDLLQDTLIHSGIAWNSAPTTEDEVLFVVGLSSRELDSASEPINGEYRITGEMVSTTQVDDFLPEGRILLVYDLERVGDSDYLTISDQGRELIESRLTQVQSTIQIQIAADTDKIAETSTKENSDQSQKTDESNNSDTKESRQPTEDKGSQSIEDDSNDSLFGIDLPDWSSNDEDEDGIISKITGGLADLFGDKDNE